MMPAFPSTHFIACQTRLALGTLDAFLDAVFRAVRAREFRRGRIRRSVGKTVVVLHDDAVFANAENHQRLGITHPTPIAFRLHRAGSRHLHHQRALLAVANVDLHPSGLGQGLTPCPRLLRGRFGFSSASRMLRRRCAKIADRGIAGNRQQITLVQTLQIAAKMAYTPQFVVADDPLVREMRRRCSGLPRASVLIAAARRSTGVSQPTTDMSAATFVR